MHIQSESAQFRSFLVVALCLLIQPCSDLLSQDAADAPDPITLDRIMSDPEWIGNAPEGGYWSDNSSSVFYRKKRIGSSLTDWFESDLEGNILRVIEDQDRSKMDSENGEISADAKLKVYERSGDLFLKDLATGATRQLTRTSQRESSPKFMSDGRRLMFRRDDVVLARHLRNGNEQELVELRFAKDPKDEEKQTPQGYLEEQQDRLFDVLRKKRSDREEAKERSTALQDADSSRPPKPWYLGDSFRMQSMQVSPNGRWCLVSVVEKKATDGQADKMPEFVDPSGYVNIRTVRSLVGTDKPAIEKLWLLDLVHHTKHEMDFSDLPEITSDRFEDVRASVTEWRKQHQPIAESKEVENSKPDDGGEAAKKQTNRMVQVSSITWNDRGDQAAVQFFSSDNKDRWVATVDFKTKKLVTHMHRFDPAWVAPGLGRMGWLSDNVNLYYVTEQTGYAQLYVTHVPSGSTRQMTQGEFVVSDVQPGADGKYIYFKANAQHPGIYEAFRVEASSGKLEQLTFLGGMNDFVVSPDQKYLLVTHSTALSPPELWIQKIEGGVDPEASGAKKITQTVSTEFAQMPWVAPQFVTIPSRSGGIIHARLYLPPGESANSMRPAVLFIHGAGYLQNAHQGWSSYFREFMFHSLLARRGFVVLDMDYQGSAGYGRDWRTAIYRHMGGPEVEDLLDGQAWLGTNHQVDVERVGLYGGSYGGFLTLMALFQNPDVFGCGAALRPVTDWAHYNHGYTANILNTPELDPEAYDRSSPIEFAGGLTDPLLICHGMVDDNVFFKDTARLSQRLIELKKKDWEVAMYPVEPHGFIQPSSWYDEYRRILELFESNLIVH